MHDDHGQSARYRTDVAVKQAPAEKEADFAHSQHLIDLAGPIEHERRAEAIRRAAALHRNPGLRFRQMLDEHIHLKDLRVRSLSVRARGWRDFPPKGSVSLMHAVALSVATFFREHPLADLTVLSLIHITFAVIWRLLVHPIRIAILTLTSEDEGPAVVSPSLLPVMPVAAGPAYAAPASWHRGIAGFAVTAMIFVLPLGAYSSIGSLRASKSIVLDRSMEGISLLRDAGSQAKSQDFAGASSAFTAAAQRFSGAKRELGAIGNIVTYAATLLPGNNPLTVAQPVLTAGREVSIGGALLTKAFSSLDAEGGPIERLRVLREYISASLPHLELATTAIRQVDPAALPEEYRASLTEARQELPALTATISQAGDVAELLETLLGSDAKRRYLIVFQNNAELRPTGGFIGSFALVDVDQGKITGMEIPGGGSYDLQGSLRARLISPQPLHLINPNWEFQDANWSPDFPTSAQRLAWFYEKSGGPTTDGVVAVNMNVLPMLLATLGPVEMPEYGTTVTAENFYTETQREVEIDHDMGSAAPKQFIADLAPKIIERITASGKTSMLELLETLQRSLATKDIQLWMRDAEVENRIRGFGWSGELLHNTGDYLGIVHTNIAGQKTDIVMREEVTHDANILADGTGIVTLTIERTHQGKKGTPFSGVRNVDYLRIYVPDGSVLVEASGFEQPDPKLFKMPDADRTLDPTLADTEESFITDRSSGTRIWQEDGKTVFGNWVQTDPGETSVVTFVYRLPPGVIGVKEQNDAALAKLYRDLTDSGGRLLSYSLTVQKQSGAVPAEFTSHVGVPKGYSMEFESPERTRDERGRYGATFVADRDVVLHTVLQAH